jgi:FlaA1/EpsC-like NDP-sugar epimerase
VPALLELEERFGGARVLITGGCGSVGRGLATFLDGFRPERITLLDAHEAALTQDLRARPPETLARTEHVLCDVRDVDRLTAELERAAPDVIFHMAAYKHVDWAERYPEEYVATNLEGSWNLLQAARAADVRTVVVASTDKAARAASVYGRTKRLMEQITALAAARGEGERLAVRLVNVLGSAGSASDLFLRQARAGSALTVTDTGMARFWVTGLHAATLMAHGGLLARSDAVLAGADDPVTMTVGELARRIWRQAGHADDPDLDVVGVRPGETMTEVMTGPGEHLGDEVYPGFAPIHSPLTLDEGIVSSVGEAAPGRARRAVWLDALHDSGAFAAPAA